MDTIEQNVESAVLKFLVILWFSCILRINLWRPLLQRWDRCFSPTIRTYGMSACWYKCLQVQNSVYVCATVQRWRWRTGPMARTWLWRRSTATSRVGTWRPGVRPRTSRGAETSATHGARGTRSLPKPPPATSMINFFILMKNDEIFFFFFCIFKHYTEPRCWAALSQVFCDVVMEITYDI